LEKERFGDLDAFEKNFKAVLVLEERVDKAELGFFVVFLLGAAG